MALLKRLNWLKYLFINMAEGQREQGYHTGKREKHLQYEHSKGIVIGLEVTETTPTPSLFVNVAAGRSLDGEGKDPETDSVQQVDLTSFVPGSGTQLVYISLAYTSFTDQDPYFVPELGITQYASIRDSYILQAQLTVPTTGEVELARVLLGVGATQITDAVDPLNPTTNEIDLRYRQRSGKEIMYLRDLVDVSDAEADAFNAMVSPTATNRIVCLAELEAHTLDTGNPHSTTASQLTDFDTEVSLNPDVVANTAARHDRNEDTILDDGGANEVSAEEIRSFLGVPNAARNLILNGNFDLWRRGITFDPGTGKYTADRWYGYENLATGILQITRYSVLRPNVKADYVLAGSAATAQSVIAAGEIAFLRQSIEGLAFRELDGQETTLSFWGRTVSGGSITLCVCIANADHSRTWIKEFTFTTTWQRFSATLAFNGGGTWNHDVGVGCHIEWILAAGSNYRGGTQETWLTGAPAYRATSGQGNLFGTGPAIVLLSQVQLTAGAFVLPFALRPPAEEIALCNRYCQKITGMTNGRIANGRVYKNGGPDDYADFIIPLKGEMRVGPSLVWSGANTDVANESTGSTVDDLDKIVSDETRIVLGATFLDNVSLAAGDIVDLRINDTDDYILFDAEL